MKRNFIAKRFQSAGTGLTLDTAALAKYKDIVDLSIGDTDFTTDEAVVSRPGSLSCLEITIRPIRKTRTAWN